MSAKSKDGLQEKKDNCWRLFFFGSFGILLPLVVVTVYDIFLRIQEIKQGRYILVVIFTCIITLLTGSAYIFYDRYPKKENRIDIFLYIIGALEMLAVGYLVYLTGGAQDSIFTFYFLFVPSIVAISFKAKWGLVTVCVTSFIAILINEIFVKPTNVYEVYAKTEHYKYQYIITIAIQLFMIFLLEISTRNGKKVKS